MALLQSRIRLQADCSSLHYSPSWLTQNIPSMCTSHCLIVATLKSCWMNCSWMNCSWMNCCWMSCFCCWSCCWKKLPGISGASQLHVLFRALDKDHGLFLQREHPQHQKYMAMQASAPPALQLTSTPQFEVCTCDASTCSCNCQPQRPTASPI